MAEMNKFFFVDRNRYKFVIPEEVEGIYLLSGYCIREGFPDNTLVTTSPVVSLEEKTATTQSGSKYNLHDMDEDYKEYLDAVKANIPIIYHWRLSGDKTNGYTIYGINNETYFSGKIISQDKNFVTLENGIKYFVVWRDADGLGLEILFTGKYLDIDYMQYFEYFAGFRSRPILFR